MNRKEVTGRLVEAGIEVKDGKVKKSDIKTFLESSATSSSSLTSGKAFGFVLKCRGKGYRSGFGRGADFEEDVTQADILGSQDYATKSLRGIIRSGEVWDIIKVEVTTKEIEIVEKGMKKKPKT